MRWAVQPVSEIPRLNQGELMNTVTELKQFQSIKGKTSKKTISLLVIQIGVLIAFGLSFYIDQDNRNLVSQMSELRQVLLNIENQSFEAHQGNTDAFDELSNSKREMNRLISRSFHTSFTTLPDITGFNNEWHANETQIDQLLQAKQAIGLSKQLCENMETLLPQLENKSENIITQLIIQSEEPNLIFLASNQLSILQSMKNSLHLLKDKQDDAARTLSLLQEDAKIFKNSLDRLLTGDKTLGINPVANSDTRAAIEDVKKDFEKVTEIDARLNELTAKINASSNAYSKVHDVTHDLFNKSSKLMNTFISNETIYHVTTWTGYILAIAGLFLAITFVFSKNNKPGFSALLSTSSGDSKTSSGTYSAQTVNSIIHNISNTSARVLHLAEDAQTTALQLSMASDKQAKHIANINSSIQKITTSIESMSEHANESVNLAKKSVTTAEHGNQAVKDTIESMQTINADIQDTSNRIKQLGESSQEIGNIVELINEIAEQTHILALNAAIKSSNANSQHDFSNVADEIQQLAERVTQATQKIESLVRSIQLDTNQAVDSMELSSAGVLNGSKLAEAAGNALDRIETISTGLANFITDVSNEASLITISANKISSTMSKIKVFTDQNLAGTKETANLNGKLVSMAKHQRAALLSFSEKENNKNERYFPGE